MNERVENGAVSFKPDFAYKVRRWLGFCYHLGNEPEGLGLTPGASAGDVQRAWKAKAMVAHPDRAGGSTSAIAEINAARDAALEDLRRS